MMIMTVTTVAFVLNNRSINGSGRDGVTIVTKTNLRTDLNMHTRANDISNVRQCDDEVSVKYNCLLVPLVFAVWWYYSRRMARRVSTRELMKKSESRSTTSSTTTTKSNMENYFDGTKSASTSKQNRKTENSVRSTIDNVDISDDLESIYNKCDDDHEEGVDIQYHHYYHCYDSDITNVSNDDNNTSGRVMNDDNNHSNNKNDFANTPSIGFAERYDDQYYSWEDVFASGIDVSVVDNDHNDAYIPFSCQKYQSIDEVMTHTTNLAVVAQNPDQEQTKSDLRRTGLQQDGERKANRQFSNVPSAPQATSTSNRLVRWIAIGVSNKNSSRINNNGRPTTTVHSPKTTTTSSSLSRCNNKRRMLRSPPKQPMWWLHCKSKLSPRRHYEIDISPSYKTDLDPDGDTFTPAPYNNRNAKCCTTTIL